MMTPFDPDALDALVKTAPQAGFDKMRFGRVYTSLWAVSWSGGDGARTPDRRQLVAGDALREGESAEIRFVVQINEFNPALDFNFDRAVPIKKSRRTNNLLTDPTDWDELVLPSLVKVFGKDWATVLLSAPYVQVEEVPNAAGKASPKTQKMYTVPKFVKTFGADRNACYAEYRKRYPTDSRPRVADGTDAGAPQFPPDVLAQVRDLLTVNSREDVLALLADKPFGNYEGVALLDALGPLGA